MIPVARQGAVVRYDTLYWTHYSDGLYSVAHTDVEWKVDKDTFPIRLRIQRINDSGKITVHRVVGGITKEWSNRLITLTRPIAFNSYPGYENNIGGWWSRYQFDNHTWSTPWGGYCIVDDEGIVLGSY